MRRRTALAALVAAVALLTAGCGADLYESPGFSAADAGADVVLWRLVGGPGGFLGVGGPVQPEDLEDGAGPLEMGPYVSADGRTWQAGEPFGSMATPDFGLASWGGGYAVSGAWDGVALVLRSADGVAWERIPLPAATAAVPELEAAGIAAWDGTIVVTGYDPGTEVPIVWVVPPGGQAAVADDTGFPTGARFGQAAAGPAGFVIAAAPTGDAGPAPPPIWVSSDGASWDPVLRPFGEGTVVTGLVASTGGYVAVVADADDDESFALWTSTDGLDWVERADQASVFAHLHGTSGDLLADLSASPGDAAPSRPIAFSFNGRWLELTELFDGHRFLAVAVAAVDGVRVASGFVDADDPLPVVLVSGG